MRKTAIVTIPADDPGRDKGKSFLLTEMPADQGEEWAIRALLALASGGLDMPDDYLGAGWQGIAAFGLPMLIKGMGGLSFDTVKPLLDEVMACVQIKEKLVTRELTPDDVEEIKTRLYLRGEVLKLHVDFSQLGAPPAPAPDQKSQAA